MPALDKTHIVIMDNATFHPKARLDEFCIDNQHFFSPLPPYCPELNPIEKAWANLKKKAKEFLPNYNSVRDCLNGAF